MSPYIRPGRRLSQRNYQALQALRENHARITAGDRPLPRGYETAAPTDYTRRPFKISEHARDAIDRLAEQAEAKHAHFDKTG